MVKFFWVFLLTLIGIVTLYFLGKGCFQVFDYMRLDAQAQAQVTQCQVVELNPSCYTLKVHYSFLNQEREIQSVGENIKDYFLNKYVAERERKLLLDQGTMKVWFRSNSPHISSLYKQFPFKNIFYGLLCLGIGLHFQKHAKKNLVESE
jgi:hypothetical protein